MPHDEYIDIFSCMWENNLNIIWMRKRLKITVLLMKRIIIKNYCLLNQIIQEKKWNKKLLTINYCLDVLGEDFIFFINRFFFALPVIFVQKFWFNNRLWWQVTCWLWFRFNGWYFGCIAALIIVLVMAFIEKIFERNNVYYQ